MANLTDDALNIIIPTDNRADFLRRLLQYFSASHVGSPIRIVDSSREDVFADNAATISDALSIEHVRDTDEMIVKCTRAMQTVSTPFSVFFADDDFLMPDSVNACMKFLNQHPDYNCASGTWMQVESHKRNRCRQIRCNQIAEEDAKMVASYGAPPEASRRLVGRCFQSLNTGKSIQFDHRRQGLQRYVDKVRKLVWRTRDRLVRDPANVWLSREITQRDPLCHSASWKLAYQLDAEFPHGIQADQQRDLRNRAV